MRTHSVNDRVVVTRTRGGKVVERFAARLATPLAYGWYAKRVDGFGFGVGIPTFVEPRQFEAITDEAEWSALLDAQEAQA